MSQVKAKITEEQPFYPHLQRYLQWPRPDYLQPLGIRTQVFTEWDRQPYKFMTEYFCHHNIVKAQVNARTSRSLTNITETVFRKNDEVISQDDIKLSFNLSNNRALCFQVRPLNYLKLTYDHGLRRYKDKYYYLSGQINANKILENTSIKLGLCFLTANGSCDNRLKANLAQNRKDNQLYWYHKSFLAYKRFRFGFISVVNFNYKILQKNDILLGYHFRPETAAYLRAYVSGFRMENPNINNVSTIVDRVTADVIHKVNDKSKVGLEGTYNIEERKIQQVKGVYQFQHARNKLIKASLTNKLDFAIVTKTTLPGFEDTGSLSVGIGVNGINTSKTEYKSGVEIQINL